MHKQLQEQRKAEEKAAWEVRKILCATEVPHTECLNPLIDVTFFTVLICVHTGYESACKSHG